MLTWEASVASSPSWRPQCFQSAGVSLFTSHVPRCRTSALRGPLFSSSSLVSIVSVFLHVEISPNLCFFSSPISAYRTVASSVQSSVFISPPHGPSRWEWWIWFVFMMACLYVRAQGRAGRLEVSSNVRAIVNQRFYLFHSSYAAVAAWMQSRGERRE